MQQALPLHQAGEGSLLVHQEPTQTYTKTPAMILFLKELFRPLPSAFLTGSQVYGSPTAASDVDIVVLLTEQDAWIVESLRDSSDKRSPGTTYFGKVNLINVEDRREYRAWYEATQYLRSVRPVTREFAIRTIREYCFKAGCKPDYPG